jgi:hypothetical protein
MSKTMKALIQAEDAGIISPSCRDNCYRDAPSLDRILAALKEMGWGIPTNASAADVADYVDEKCRCAICGDAHAPADMTTASPGIGPVCRGCAEGTNREAV